MTKQKLPKLLKIPRNYQKKGIRYIHNHNGRALIADQMGLGKTIQAIGFTAMQKDAVPALIVCPASVKLNWKRELKETVPRDLNILILNGKKPDKIPTGYDYVICNYDILADWKLSIISYPFKTIILDEIHKIKNSKAKRTKAVKTITKKIKNCIGLSGTPIENRPAEIYNGCKIIRPDLFSSEWDFWWEFCGMKKTRFGWDRSGSSNQDKLRRILSLFMLRRTKDEVLPDLPNKVKTIVPFEVNKKIYDEIYAEFLSWLNSGNSKNIAKTMVRITKMKRAAALAKLDSVVDWIRDFVESDEKLVLFTHHREVLDYLMTKLKHISVKVEGGMSSSQRQKSIEEFQNNNRVRLFIGNMKAAGEGIDGLQKVCSNCGIVEFPYNPSLLDQAEDRIHRIGQDSSVNVWYFVAEGTIEEDIIEILSEKQKVISLIIDGEEEIEDDLISKLLKKIKKDI